MGCRIRPPRACSAEGGRRCSRFVSREPHRGLQAFYASFSKYKPFFSKFFQTFPWRFCLLSKVYEAKKAFFAIQGFLQIFAAPRHPRALWIPSLRGIKPFGDTVAPRFR